MMIVQEQQQQDARQRSRGRGAAAAAGWPTSQTSRLQEGGLEAVEATPP